jgi:hypothetical protein
VSVTRPIDNGTDRRLPPLRAVLVVDAERFSKVPSAQQSPLNATIENVLDAAFARAGLAEAWADRRFSTHTGDGYVVGLPVEWLPQLVHPFLDELQAELKDRHDRRMHSDPPLRLRASLHYGPLPDEGRPNDGVGQPMVDAHRLVDADVLRRALREGHHEVTFLAALVSQRVFDDVVKAGYTKLHVAQFRPVEVTVKTFEESAYLYVPQSGPVEPGERGEPGAADAGRPPRPTASVIQQCGGNMFNGPTNVHDVVAGDQWKSPETDR